MNNHSRTQNSKYNIMFGMASKIIITILTFISRSLFIHILSVEYLGINGLFGDVLAMLSLADLGFGTAMAYSFYKPLAEKDENKLAALIGYYKKIYHVIALAVAIIGILIIPFLKYIINVEKEIPHLTIYYLVFLANTVFSYLFVYKASIISADQKGYLVAKYSVIIQFSKVFLQIVVLYLTHNYLVYILVTVLSTIANNLLISYKANKLYPFINENTVLSKPERADIFVNMKSVFIYKVSSVLLNGTDNTIMSVIVGTAAVGLYSNYNTLISNLSQVAGILFSSLTASVGNLVVREKEEKRFDIFRTMQMVSFWLSGFFITCLYFLTENFINLWIGDNFLFDRISLIAILANFYLALTLQPIWSFREATGLYKKTKYIMLITAALNIILSIILGKYIGVAGIVLATLISKVSTYFWFEPKILFNDFFNKKVGSYYYNHMVNLLVVIGVIAGIQFITLPTEGLTWLSWLFNAIYCAVIVNIIYLIRYFWTKEFKFVVNKFLKK